MAQYTIKIMGQSKELDPQTKIQLRIGLAPVVINEMAKLEGGICLRPDMWIDTQVHNEYSSKNTDYRQFLFRDAQTGVWYSTGSENLFQQITDIFEELQQLPPEWTIRIESKRTKSGNQCLIASLIKKTETP